MSKVMPYIYGTWQQFIWRGFPLNWDDGSGITTVWNFDLKNLESRSCRRPTVMTYIYGPLFNDLFGFSFVSIGMAVLGIRPFKTLTLRIRCSGHTRGQRLWPTWSTWAWTQKFFGIYFVSIWPIVHELWSFNIWHWFNGRKLNRRCAKSCR